MRVIDQTVSGLKQVRLNDIPVKQVFKGRVLGHTTGKWFTGTFLKVAASVNLKGENLKGERHDVLGVVEGVVVQLDGDFQGRCGIFLHCTEVLDYEPVEATLTLTKVAK